MDFAFFFFFIEAGLTALVLLFFLGAALAGALFSAPTFELSVSESSDIDKRVGEDVGDEQSMMTLAVCCRLGAAVYESHVAGQISETEL